MEQIISQKKNYFQDGFDWSLEEVHPYQKRTLVVNGKRLDFGFHLILKSASARCHLLFQGLDSNPSQSCLILAYFQSSVSHGACRQGWSYLFTSGQLKVCQKQKIACSRQRLSAARTKFPGERIPWNFY